MTRAQITNNASTTLLTAISSSGTTSVVVASGKGALFPATGYFYVTLNDGTNIEICQCTSRSSDTLTVVRGAEGTTAQSSWATGTAVKLNVTAAVVAEASAYPVTSFSGDYTLTAQDAGCTMYRPSTDSGARTLTIPANSSVPFPVGTIIKVANRNQNNTLAIAITTDTLRNMPGSGGSSGSRTLNFDGMCELIKVESTIWLIWGVGIS